MKIFKNPDSQINIEVNKYKICQKYKKWKNPKVMNKWNFNPEIEFHPSNWICSETKELLSWTKHKKKSNLKDYKWRHQNFFKIYAKIKKIHLKQTQNVYFLHSINYYEKKYIQNQNRLNINKKRTTIANKIN